jgi:hypothetical protein
MGKTAMSYVQNLDVLLASGRGGNFWGTVHCTEQYRTESAQKVFLSLHVCTYAFVLLNVLYVLRHRIAFHAVPSRANL